MFAISWVNPDERHADKGLDAYMHEGILAALTAIEEAVDDFRTVVAACRAAALGSVAADGLSVSGLAVGALLGLTRSAASSAALELWGIVRLAAGASAAASAGVAFTPDLRFFSRMFAIKKRFLSPPGEDRVPFSS